MASNDTNSTDTKKGSGFWDSTFALVLLVAAILFGRFMIAEPFKIPSGSMEPTLFGHEDYGDRIVTNKLAYETGKQCALVAAGALALVLVGYFASGAHRRPKSRIIGAIIFFAVGAGFYFAWSRDAIAGDPQRFDVVVFQYDTYWQRPHGVVDAKSQKINYIKRLCGLPGDRLKIAGGDLWLYDKNDDRYKILRKWQTDDALQEELWYPVALAWTGDVYKDAPAEERDHIAIPWNGAEKGARGIERKSKSFVVTGESDVALTYAHQVSNVYLKQGRWPFRHAGCPATKDDMLQGPSGALFRNPESKTPEITSYIFHTWEGVQCPNCKKVMFPIALIPQDDPSITQMDHFPNGDSARFFYGGNHTVGDLKLELDIDVEKAGAITLEVGNSLHRAVWAIGGTAPDDTPTTHGVDPKIAKVTLTPGHHRITLAYVDATVIARIDGDEARRLIDVEMPGPEADGIQSIAKVSFSGVKGTVTKLDLYRDLYHTNMILDSSTNRDAGPGAITGNQSDPPFIRGFDKQGRYEAEVPPGYYLMLGDNSPSSSDGRVWGFVPRENLVGRASFIAWPVSRLRLIR